MGSHHGFHSASEKNVPIACYVEYFSSGRKDKITKHDLVEHFIFNISTGAWSENVVGLKKQQLNSFLTFFKDLLRMQKS